MDVLTDMHTLIWFAVDRADLPSDIAQVTNRNLAIISKDESFNAYGIKRLW